MSETFIALFTLGCFLALLGVGHELGEIRSAIHRCARSLEKDQMERAAYMNEEREYRKLQTAALKRRND
jgi:hypothetical protein